MRRVHAVTLALLLVPALASAQAPDPFAGFNTTGTAQPPATTATTATASNAPAAGPAAPWTSYGYYGSQWNGSYSYGNYAYYQQVSRQYNQDMDNLYYMERNYPQYSSYRQSIEAFRSQGRSIFERYRRYQDSGSLYQLETWMSQAQSYFSSYGYGGYNGGYYGGYDWNTYPYYGNTGNGNYGWWGTGGCGGSVYAGYSGYSGSYYGAGYGCGGGSYGSGCDAYGNCSYLPNYSPYNVYPQMYYGAYAGVNDPALHALGLGDGIANIIYGSQYGNNLQLAGGALSTLGNVLNLTNDSRYYGGYRY